MVAMRRIQKFLLCDEINPSIVCQQKGTPEFTQEVAIQIKNDSSYHWGIKADSLAG
jgi:hypothetical protein